MSTFKWQIRWDHVYTLDVVSDAIEVGSDRFPGLTSAEQIISITWMENRQQFCVVWKVREWQGVEADG